jgi:hypothetical protein
MSVTLKEETLRCRVCGNFKNIYWYSEEEGDRKKKEFYDHHHKWCVKSHDAFEDNVKHFGHTLWC